VTIAVINCGSSSIKYSLFEQQKQIETNVIQNLQKENYEAALTKLAEKFKASHSLIAVGHRVVHGGPDFHKPTFITASILEKIKSYSSLAPLHNPLNILGIEIMQSILKNLPQVAVFDTAFHHTIPHFAHIYPIPYEYYENHQIRRYGFHGISHEYLMHQASLKLQKSVDQCSLITAHLGNGCSITAIKNGKSVDTSMGFTPLEGVMMGTRSGSIDPSIVETIAKDCKNGVEDAMLALNRKSGLLGISGISNDMRKLHEAKSERAHLAIDMFVHSISKTIASMRTNLSSLDALVFSGGIGENDAIIREKIIERIPFLDLHIDKYKNLEHGKHHLGIISSSASLPIFVIPTDEEKMIMQEVLCLLSS